MTNFPCDLIFYHVKFLSHDWLIFVLVISTGNIHHKIAFQVDSFIYFFAL